MREFIVYDKDTSSYWGPGTRDQIELQKATRFTVARLEDFVEYCYMNGYPLTDVKPRLILWRIEGTRVVHIMSDKRPITIPARLLIP